MSVETILEQLGISVESENGNELLAHCPGHKERTGREDAHPSWWINSATGAHICFSCGFKGHLPYLVATVRGVKNSFGLLDFDAARRWVEEFGGVASGVAFYQIAGDRYLAPVLRTGLPEYQLAMFQEPPTWALNERHISADAAAHYGVLWDPEEENWITPIRDVYNSVLLGWQAKGQKTRFFRNRPSGVQKSTTVFGADRYVGGNMVLVESPLDAVRLLTVGITGAVSTFGANVSEEQYHLLRRADTLIVAMDNPRIDQAGKKAVEEFLSATRRLRFDCKFFNYTGIDVKDVGEMSHEQIHRGISTAKHSVYGKQVLLQ